MITVEVGLTNQPSSDYMEGDRRCLLRRKQPAIAAATQRAPATDQVIRSGPPARRTTATNSINMPTPARAPNKVVELGEKRPATHSATTASGASSKPMDRIVSAAAAARKAASAQAPNPTATARSDANPLDRAGRAAPRRAKMTPHAATDRKTKRNRASISAFPDQVTRTSL